MPCLHLCPKRLIRFDVPPPRPRYPTLLVCGVNPSSAFQTHPQDPFSHFDFDGVLGLGLETLALSDAGLVLRGEPPAAGFAHVVVGGPWGRGWGPSRRTKRARAFEFRPEKGASAIEKVPLFHPWPLEGGRGWLLGFLFRMILHSQ